MTGPTEDLYEAAARDAIAEILATHSGPRWRGPRLLECPCGWSLTYEYLHTAEAAAEHRRHVADVLMAAVAPPIHAAGVAAGRAQAAADIRAHMDHYASDDGNFYQLRLRRHLGIAERIAAESPTLKEVAEELNKILFGENWAGGEPRG